MSTNQTAKNAWQNLSKGQQLTAAGGVTALVAGFLPWYVLKEQFVDNVSFKGTEFTFGWMGLALLLAAAALTIAPAFGKKVGNDQITGEQIAIVAAAVGSLLWLIRIVQIPVLFFGVMGRGVGLYLAAGAAVAVTAGVIITMKEKGIAMPTMDNMKSVKTGVTATSTTQPGMAAPAPAPAPAPVQHPAPVDNSGRVEF